MLILVTLTLLIISQMLLWVVTFKYTNNSSTDEILLQCLMNDVAPRNDYSSKKEIIIWDVDREKATEVITDAVSQGFGPAYEFAVEHELIPKE